MSGLNTAATLWASAAVGTLCGSGMEAAAAIGATAIMLANMMLRPIGAAIDARRTAQSHEALLLRKLGIGPDRCRILTWVYNGMDVPFDELIDNDIDIFVMGDDWKGKFDDLSDICRVVYLPRTPDVSSTELKNSLREEKE